MDINRIANPGALNTKVYVPGKSKREVEEELHIPDIIKLASNESASGTSPLAKHAYASMAEQLHLYPDATSRDLRSRLSAFLRVSPETITVANGADGIIYNVGMAVIGQDDEIIIPESTFAMYESITRIMRGAPVHTPLDGYRIDLDAILDAISPRTKAIFLCNPNNPTGDVLPKDELVSFLRKVPEHVLIALDEAYIEFVEKDFDPGAVELFRGGMENLFIIRTFSKLYGIAGLRVGYAVGQEELIRLIHRIKEPFNVSSPAEYAALKALDDHDFKHRTLDQVFREREFYYRNLDEMGLKYVQSHTNFVFIDMETDATVVSDALLRTGVIVRPGAKFGLPNCIRVTIGTRVENERFFSALREILKVSGSPPAGGAGQ
jgi:histidinol-phosphate aminotransferase